MIFKTFGLFIYSYWEFLELFRANAADPTCKNNWEGWISTSSSYDDFGKTSFYNTAVVSQVKFVFGSDYGTFNLDIPDTLPNFLSRWITVDSENDNSSNWLNGHASFPWVEKTSLFGNICK